MSTLNSLLYLPKTYGNYNMPPTFASILFSALKELKAQFTVKKCGKFNDVLSVKFPNGKSKTVLINGSTSVLKIKKQLGVV